MGRVVALGGTSALAGFSLVGVDVLAPETGDGIRRAWASLDDDVVLVLLSRNAAAALGDRLVGDERPLTVVAP